MAPLGISSGLMYASWVEGGPAIQGSEYSINFDGTDGYVDTGDTYQSTFRDSFTLACWCKFGDGQPGQLDMLFGAIHSSGQDAIYLQNTTAGRLQLLFRANSDSVGTLTDAAVFSDGATDWQHIAVTVTKNSSADTTVIFYVDGAAVDTTTSNALSDTNHGAYTSSADLFIGARNNTTFGGSTDFFLGGLLDDFAIWDVALDADAVEAMYNSGVPFDLTGDSGSYDNSGDLVAYYRFNEGNGTTALDTGGSNNATLVGGATYSNDTV